MAKKQWKKTTSMSDLSAKYPGAGVATEKEIDWEDQLWVPCTDPLMTAALGGGACYGRIMEIAGQESSGKTLLAMDLIKNAQTMGGVGIFVDAELAFDHSWAELNGLDLDELLLFPEMAIEVISDFVAESCFMYRSQLTNNEPIVLVIDSVAALDTIAATQTAKADKKAEMGSRAKAIYEMIRLRNRLWNKLGICVIFINQLRDKINTGFGSQFQEKTTTVGGNALKFFASQRLFLETKKQITIGSKTNKRMVGVETLVTMKKNKLAIKQMPVRVKVIFDPDHDDLGFHSSGDKLADVLIRKGTLVKSGNEYKFGDKTLATSRGKLEAFLEEDSDERDDVLYDAKIPTVNIMQERLDDLSENLYPVDGITFAVTGSSQEEEEDE